ncbi:MAG: hypothetical protein Q8R92_16765 [Deltaproteobacteria bacterium]|nr:hypothetical protein [Deltaproteobacteria bacterium]
MALVDLYERTLQFLTSRALAYRRAFNPANRDVRVVLADLARFCRANRSTAHADPYVAARLDGRRETWLRIQQHLNLTTAELYRLYGGVDREK